MSSVVGWVVGVVGLGHDFIQPATGPVWRHFRRDNRVRVLSRAGVGLPNHLTHRIDRSPDRQLVILFLFADMGVTDFAGRLLDLIMMKVVALISPEFGARSSFERPG